MYIRVECWFILYLFHTPIIPLNFFLILPPWPPNAGCLLEPEGGCANICPGGWPLPLLPQFPWLRAGSWLHERHQMCWSGTLQCHNKQWGTDCVSQANFLYSSKSGGGVGVRVVSRHQVHPSSPPPRNKYVYAICPFLLRTWLYFSLFTCIRYIWGVMKEIDLWVKQNNFVTLQFGECRGRGRNSR